MSQATITIPEELKRELEAYARRQEDSPEISAVVQRVLRDFLQRQEELGKEEFRPLRITPANVGSGHSDISVNHDAYIADDTYTDKFSRP